jgi:hypothetical protein
MKFFFSILGEITVKGEKGERGLRVSKFIIIDIMYGKFENFLLVKMVLFLPRGPQE